MKTDSSYHHGDLKNALIEAALHHIEMHREVSFTLRELAIELGVSSAAPFRHFATKKDLLAKIAEIGFLNLTQQFLKIDQEQNRNPLSCFQQKGIAYVQFAVSNQASFLTMWHPDLSKEDDFPVLKDLSEQAFASLRASVEACKRAKLLSEFESDDIALSAWSTVHGLAMLLVSQQLKKPLGLAPSKNAGTQAAETVTAILGAGFLKKNSSKSK